MADDNGSAASNRNTDGDEKLVVDVDGEKKEYTVEDVQTLVGRQAGMTQKAQSAQKVLDVVDKYGTDTDTFLSQAEGAFGVISQLIDEGVVDKSGNVIKKKEPGDSKGKVDDLDKTIGLKTQGDKGTVAASDVEAIIAKALTPHLDRMSEKIGKIDSLQSDMIRVKLQDELKGKHKTLDNEDVSKIFGTAMNDPTKNLWQHAEDYAKVKEASVAELREKHAKEFGVDVKEFDANKLKEQSAEGGAAGIFTGKKFSFKKGKDNVSPAEATKELFRKNL